MNETETRFSAATLIFEREQLKEERSTQESSESRRKSVENLLMSSHDVIGSSISSSLTFSAMTLPTTSNIANPNGSLDPRSASPSSSPQSSPRPSPRQHHKPDSCKADNVTSIGIPSDKPDATETESLSRSSDHGQVVERNSSANDSCKERKESRGTDRAKKKHAWYHALYPTYKSKNEDFKRLFRGVAPEERLIVDYSCALQKEIIVHGRLYASQNNLCFYSNIFGWETQLSIRWKDVTALTKEKTALVIPNAILVCTVTEKYFLTSFVARDKTFLMLFRVWQNALMDQQFSIQEIWRWVHRCYGDELGLTSDDEDYIPPGEEKLAAARLSLDSLDECYAASEAPMDQLDDTQEEMERESISLTHFPPSSANSSLLEKQSPGAGIVSTELPTDMSDTTESDVEKAVDKKVAAICNSPHEGRKLVRVILPIHVDQLFTLLFTGSKFLLDFHAHRKTTDMELAPWTPNTETSIQHRTITMTLALNHAMGPKTAQVSEHQMMRKCSKPGELYSIDVETANAGIPYAESFGVNTHYCLSRTGENESCLAVYGQIKYKKTVWGFVKGFIEKNTWAGLEDHFGSLVKSLQLECDHDSIAKKKVPRRRRRGTSVPPTNSEEVTSILGNTLKRKNVGDIRNNGHDRLTWTVLTVLILLVIVNAVFYYKLWVLEKWTQRNDQKFSWIDLQDIRHAPKSQEEWLQLFQQQEVLHNIEMQKWQEILQGAIQLLQKTEVSLNELQVSINPKLKQNILSSLKTTNEEEGSITSISWAADSQEVLPASAENKEMKEL